jgi:hypothetical protein
MQKKNDFLLNLLSQQTGSPSLVLKRLERECGYLYQSSTKLKKCVSSSQFSLCAFMALSLGTGKNFLLLLSVSFHGWNGKAIQKFIQYYRLLSRDSNSRSPNYEAEMLTTKQRRSVKRV